MHEKTFKLTLKQLSVRILSAVRERGAEIDLKTTTHHPLPDEFHELLVNSVLTSNSSPPYPMEEAVRRDHKGFLINTMHRHLKLLRVREHPLSPKTSDANQVWRSSNTGAFVVGAKGALEAIANICHLHHERIDEATKTSAERGLRVLSVVRASLPECALRRKQNDFDLDFLGLLGLADPVRPSVTKSMRDYYRAGVRVIMFIVDQAHTAITIVSSIGLKPPYGLITCSKLPRMGGAERPRILKTINYFARVVFEQKLRLVKDSQSNGEVVAMTDDDVNNASVLKVAQIAIYIDGRGTDGAHESVVLILWWVIVAGPLFRTFILYPSTAFELFRSSLLHPIELANYLSAILAIIAYFKTWEIIQGERRL